MRKRGHAQLFPLSLPFLTFSLLHFSASVEQYGRPLLVCPCFSGVLSKIFENNITKMADSAVETKETVTPAVEKETEKPVVEKVEEEEKQAENGDAKENGDKVEEEVETKKETENGDATEEDHEACPVKRKSAGGDAPEGTPAEGASPEKKAKLEEKPTAEAEANGAADAKVAA